MDVTPMWFAYVRRSTATRPRRHPTIRNPQMRHQAESVPPWSQVGFHVMNALEAGEDERQELAEKLNDSITAQKLTAQRVAIYIATATAGGGGIVALVMKTMGAD
jgi:hypothetical protein